MTKLLLTCQNRWGFSSNNYADPTKYPTLYFSRHPKHGWQWEEEREKAHEFANVGDLLAAVIEYGEEQGGPPPNGRDAFGLEFVEAPSTGGTQQ